jgi:hypothetical protein
MMPTQNYQLSHYMDFAIALHVRPHVSSVDLEVLGCTSSHKETPGQAILGKIERLVVVSRHSPSHDGDSKVSMNLEDEELDAFTLQPKQHWCYMLPRDARK